MRIETWDSGFVRATRRDVHGPLALPLEDYDQWWPGLRTRVLADGSVEWRLRPPAIWPGQRHRSHRVVVTLIKRRANLGLSFAFSGDLNGEAEFFYLDERDGVVVSYVLRVDSRGGARRGRRLARQHRAAARAALHSLKDRFEGARVPGTQPEQDLLDKQVVAIEEFKAGVEAHARKMAAAEAEAATGQ